MNRQKIYLHLFLLTTLASHVSGSYAASTTPMRIQSRGAAANIPFYIMPKGGGGVSTRVPDGTEVGGSNRGLYSVDLQSSYAVPGLPDMVALGDYSVVAGGRYNGGSAAYSAVLGGYWNWAAGVLTSISGGSYNITGPEGSFIGGGYRNRIGDPTGGLPANGLHAVIGGGAWNRANGDYSFVGGGGGGAGSGGTFVADSNLGNIATGLASFIGAGRQNRAAGFYSGVSSGVNNNASGMNSYIGGGMNNSTGTTATYTAIAGGLGNSITAQMSGILGGSSNTITAVAAGALAGMGSSIGHAGAATAGGLQLISTRMYQLVAGQYNNATELNATNSLFIVGAGSGVASRQNIFTVASTGAVHEANVKGNFYVRQIASGAVSLTVTDTGNVTATSYTATSDYRLKKNFVALDRYSLYDKLNQMNAVYFDWKSPSLNSQGRRQLGLIAQDVEKAFPELVSTTSEGYKSVNYSGLVAPLIEAVKMQHEDIETLRKENLELREALKAMQRDIANIRDAIEGGK